MSHDLYGIVDSEEGPVGMLYLQLRTLHDTGAVMTEVMLDSALLMSDQNTISEEALATITVTGTSAVAVSWESVWSSGSARTAAVAGAGRAFVVNNMISGARNGAIRALDHAKPFGPDLARTSAESFRNLTVFANVSI